MEALRRRFLQKDLLDEWLHFRQYLDNMHGLLCHTLQFKGESLISIQPLCHPTPYRFRTNLLDTSKRYVLSRFAFFRRSGTQMVLTTPLGYANVLLLNPCAYSVLAALSQPKTVHQLSLAVNLNDAVTTLFLNILLNAETLTSIEKDQLTAEDSAPTLSHWEFHDLLFHSRSRLGRHGRSYGGTYRFKDKFDPPPPVKPGMSDDIIPLYKPDMEKLKKIDPSFVDVVERRRSIRKHGDEPISIQQLGEFLYRVARIQNVYTSIDEAQTLSFRPYPGGGAVHELEIYPIINQCNGISAGLYHYNPLNHQLHRLADKNEDINKFLDMAQHALKQPSQPQILQQ